MTNDLFSRAAPFLNQCGPCGYGLPTSCTCPAGDWRPVMAELVREVERLRGIAEAAHAFITFPKRPEGPDDPDQENSWDDEAERRFHVLRDAVIGIEAKQ